MTEHDDQAAAPEMTALPDTGDAAELTELRKQHDAQAATVRGLEEREAVSRSAAASLEADHLAGLAEGRSDPELRQRHENAAKDAADWAKGAELARGKLAAIGQQIEAVRQRITIAALGAELAEAIAARDAVLARTGERQRQAVTAVRAAAEEFTAALADELAAVRRVDQLAAQIGLGGPMPAVPPAQGTALWVPSEFVAGEPVHLARALSAARKGDVTRVAAELGEANGWLPPDPSVIAAERERVLALRAQQAPQPARPVQPQPVMDPRFGASYGVDEHGHPLPPPSPAELERRRNPAPAGPVGWLGGQPWPR